MTQLGPCYSLLGPGESLKAPTTCPTSPFPPSTIFFAQLGPCYSLLGPGESFGESCLRRIAGDPPVSAARCAWCRERGED